MVGQQYELEKKVSWGGDRKSKTFQENQLGHCDQVDKPRETRERIVHEHNISPKTVQRSADLYKSHQAVKEAAPDVAQKLETEEIKASQKDILALGKGRSWPVKSGVQYSVQAARARVLHS